MRVPFDAGQMPTTANVPTLATAMWAALKRLERAISRGPSTQTLTRSTTLPDGVETEHVLYRCDATNAAFTVTLPKSVASLDTRFTLKRISGGANVVTWQTQGTDTVDGATTGTLATQYAVLRLHARDGGWDVL